MEHTFTDVTIYRASDMMGNIHRQDVKTLKIVEGIKYAQYNNATRVEYLEKGKRKAHAFMLTYAPFLVVVHRADAINPDDMFNPGVASTPGVIVSRSRYSSFDPRWKSDFVEALNARNVRPLFMLHSAEDGN